MDYATTNENGEIISLPVSGVSGTGPAWADLIARLERIEAKLDTLRRPLDPDRFLDGPETGA